MSDGAIVFSTKLDNKDLEKELAKLGQKIKKLEDDIYSSKQKRMALLEQSKQLGAVLDEAKAKLYEMRDATKGTYSATEISEQKERVRGLQSEFNKVVSAADRLGQKIDDATVDLGQAKEQAGELQQRLAKSGPNTEKMARSMEKARKSANKFALRLREVTRSALLFTLISQALAKFRDWMGSVIKTNSEATAAIARLKGALLTMAQPLVDAVIPAFIALVNILTRVISVIAQLVALLFGTTAKNASDAAEDLYKEKNAIEGVGDAAKQATKQLAGFDEINQLTNNTASSSSGIIAPDFSGLKFSELPEWLTSLTISLSDILFEWEDLTTEDVLKKVVAALTTLAGAVIGFSLGGVGGAVIGMVVGASLGAWISELLFDDDGEMSKEEVLKSLCVALGTLVGGILGFAVGGIGGAAVGVAVGASAGALLSDLIFDNDGVVSKDEVIKSLCIALGALVGGILGFSLGGPGGALVGVSLGAAASATLSELVFGGTDKGRGKAILTSLCGALGAIVGGVIGFAVGGPAGAVIGITIGAAVTIKLSDILFEGFSDIKKYNPNFTGFGPDYSWMFKSSAKSVPGLATGSVIPPNRKFLAVLGDNKTETEVVSPLSTMKQAMMEALQESGAGAGGTYTFVVNLDGKEIARNQVKHINNMTIEAGKPVLMF